MIIIPVNPVRSPLINLNKEIIDTSLFRIILKTQRNKEESVIKFPEIKCSGK